MTQHRKYDIIEEHGSGTDPLLSGSFVLKRWLTIILVNVVTALVLFSLGFFLIMMISNFQTSKQNVKLSIN